jgi:hypothetical protein
MSAKPKKPPVWSQPASTKAALAIRELKKLKEQQAILTKKSALLQQIIIAEGGGQAHGVRAAIRHQHASERRTIVRTKARTFVTFLEPVSSPT